MTGIAAILRFEMPDLDDQVESDEGDLDSDDEPAGGLITADDKSSTSSRKKGMTSNSETDKESVDDESIMDDDFDNDMLDDIFGNVSDGDDLAESSAGPPSKKRKNRAVR